MCTQGQMQDAMNTGLERHGRYLREADVARALRPYSMRARAARAMRAWADRLEPAVAPDTLRPDFGPAC